MSGRADERPYEPPAPETGPAVTSANLTAQDTDRKVAEQAKTEDKKSTKRGSAKN